MIPPLLTLHFCRTHHLLFVPSPPEWLSFTPVRMEQAFGEVLRLTDSACPRCLPGTPWGPFSLPRDASGARLCPYR